MQKFRNIIITLVITFNMLIITACGTINVSGKTFRFKDVHIDWGVADSENKQSIYEEYQVKDEKELIEVLKTRDGRNSRFTTFGTNDKYTTKNSNNEIIDEGYYKQDETVITLADTIEGLSQVGAYTLHANDKGYIVTIKLNDQWKVFAKYQYVEQE